MGTGPMPGSARATGAATLIAALALGCSAVGGPSGGPADAPAGAPAPAPGTPAPHTTSPAELCTALVTHWSGVLLDAGQGRDAVGLDYQAMGLSGAQYEILRAVTAAARAEERTGGPAAGRALAAREAGARCAERHRSGAPTDGPWQ
ncbi:hypothetical protein [Streptomyces sp. H27-S2]|uniref:hypothetical protein n=1 Tax=Streptomyces antarcticus TaxID=2996458 RepID=UPI0022716769|nr:hypothetical protein [Streptomyces sp. H27-S2]MCY0952143.1 hypothetical protein [Streptomyces sp. H27-S2]